MMPAVRPRRGTHGDESTYFGSGGPRHATNAGGHGGTPSGAGRPTAQGWVANMPDWQGGALAGAELADRLKQAWVIAGRPHMGVIGDEVGYSKATISKVLSGKMAPAWHLVRKLGVALGVPAETVADQWHPLWIAADNFRRGVADSGSSGTAARTGGHTCERCGSWVVNSHLHAAWHLRLEQPAAETAASRMADSLEWASLRDAVSRREES
jgi:transcriptional regulator with XRE-family HTH domain